MGTGIYNAISIRRVHNAITGYSVVVKLIETHCIFVRKDIYENNVYQHSHDHRYQTLDLAEDSFKKQVAYYMNARQMDMVRSYIKSARQLDLIPKKTEIESTGSWDLI